MNRRLELLLEIIFIIFIFLDGFLLFISIFLPIKPTLFINIVFFDLITSILLLLGYLIKIRGHEKNTYVKQNWNGFISIAPFYFIGIVLLGMNETSIILKILCFIKIFALLFSARQIGRYVDDFVERSRLIYGFAFFVVVLLFCSVAFFMLEKGINPGVNTFEDSFWYIIQTITTVGYGDVVPDTQWGRLIGIIAMISAIGITSLLTAATTSSLMDKLREDREKMAKSSINYFKELENKINDLESNLIKRENIDEIKTDLKNIKAEMNEIKGILTEMNKK
ncbi:MAG: ion channel [Euryarchaeota archaeon]|jgi:voltage-gated potassium channel|uniref:potassium channel family protein n=1 Tax=Methanobacterium sp. MZD130B TaxID=3394378 RepID=UPI001770A2A4|nr:ion channel [Euryarchaeota archaeon]HHT19417.1 potassium channel-like protein [Methanobacterium sp.]